MRGVTNTKTDALRDTAPPDSAPRPFMPSLGRSANNGIRGATMQTTMARMIRRYVTFYHGQIRAAKLSPRQARSSNRQLEDYENTIKHFMWEEALDESQSYVASFAQHLSLPGISGAKAIPPSEARAMLLNNASRHADTVLPDYDLARTQAQVIKGLAAYCASREGGKAGEAQAYAMLNGLSHELFDRRHQMFLKHSNQLIQNTAPRPRARGGVIRAMANGITVR